MYVGVIFSGGLFTIPWLLLILRDINKLESRRTFRVQFHTVSLLLGPGLYFLSVIFLILTSGEFSSGRQLWVIATFLFGFGLVLYQIALLARASLHIADMLRYRRGMLHIIGIVALTLLSGLSYIIVQRRLNVLIERRRNIS
jgi:hypothetical protein